MKFQAEHSNMADLIAKMRQGFRNGVLPYTTVQETWTVPVWARDYPYETFSEELKSALEPFFQGEGPNVLFSGSEGRYKSTTAYAVCEEWLARGGKFQGGRFVWPNVVFVDWAELLGLASAIEVNYGEKRYTDRMIFEPDFASRFLPKLFNADLLVVDNVGKGNNAELEPIIYTLVDERYSRGRQTLYVTDSSTAELQKLLGQWGEWLVSRMTCSLVLQFQERKHQGQLVEV